jgi:hypothetical protein
VGNFRILSSEIRIGGHLEIIPRAPVHPANRSFFHLPSSSNAANDVKQLVRRRAFPRAIVGCNCFADIVQNTQGGQCLQPTAIYNSYQFFCLQIPVALLTDCQYSQRTSMCACFKGHCIFAWRCSKNSRGYRNRSNATSTTTQCGISARPPYESRKSRLRQKDGACPFSLLKTRSMCLSLVAATSRAACTAHMRIRGAHY